MVARSLADVRSAFDDEKLAAEFGRTFMQSYAAVAFGTLPKRELDLLVFAFLVRKGVVDTDRSMYRIARALNITPTKARGLLFEYQLRHVSESETDHAVMMAITTARYWKDGSNLSFGISSPLVKAAIAGRMQDDGVFADVSLSGDILRVNPEHFGRVISSLVSDAQAERVLARLKKAGLADASAVRKAIDALGRKSAQEMMDKGVSRGMDELFGGLKELFSSGDSGAPELLAGSLDAA